MGFLLAPKYLNYWYIHHFFVMLAVQYVSLKFRKASTPVKEIFVGLKRNQC